MVIPKLNRNQYRKEIERRIGRRRLIWFGTRGTDAQSLLEFPQFVECYSQIAPLGAVALQTDLCLEDIGRARVDLNNYNIDLDESDHARELHRSLVRACEAASVLVAYRPAAFLTSAYFPRAASVEYLGLFQERQAAFEHKPWVETALTRAGIPIVPWRYVTDEDDTQIIDLLAHGPQVLRANRSSGGVGLALLRSRKELRSRWPKHSDGFLAAAPYLVPNVPLNISGCVFPSGEVTLHAPSLQLIGIPSCTTRVFGYCGNDFARVRELDRQVLDSLEEITLAAGRWLHRMGYAGAFGVDALAHEGNVYLAEINPRFQGSSQVAAGLAADMGIPDIFYDHIAAFLGLDAPPLIHVPDLARTQPPRAHIICYNRKPHAVRRRPNRSVDATEFMPHLLPNQEISVAPEAILFKVIVDRSVTTDGQSLIDCFRTSVEKLVSHYFVAHS